jgi:hypothetical protein
MTFDPSALAMCAFVLLGASLLTEAYLTYRDWCRRRQERQRPPHSPTPGPRLVARRYRDAEDQAPYGTGTSLIQ